MYTLVLLNTDRQKHTHNYDRRSVNTLFCIWKQLSYLKLHSSMRNRVQERQKVHWQVKKPQIHMPVWTCRIETAMKVKQPSRVQISWPAECEESFTLPWYLIDVCSLQLCMPNKDWPTSPLPKDAVELHIH